MNIDILISEKQIQHRVIMLAQDITQLFMDQKFILLTVEAGGIPFSKALKKEIHADYEEETVQVSSYFGQKTSQSNPLIIQNWKIKFSNQTILIIDDILDTGETLHKLKQELISLGAKNIYICVLLRKTRPRLVPIDADFVGFEIEDHFVVGFGLDYQNQYRELPYIGILR